MLALLLLGCQAWASESMADMEMMMNSKEVQNYYFICGTPMMYEQSAWIAHFLATLARNNELASKKKNIDVKDWPWYKTKFDLNQFVNYIESKAGAFNTRSFKTTQVDGGVWIYGNADEMMLSAYMHPTKWHSAGIVSGATGQVLPSDVKSVAPGQWCVVFGNPHSPSGSKPVYKVE